jgi:8-oxo-dGTP pyrophosphatase MutT (NUDIX family)
MQKSATVALVSNNRLLLLERGHSAPWNPNKYCLPGGKLEDNESLISCAIRELKEETNIDLSSGELVPVAINYPRYSKTIFVCCDNQNYTVKLNWEHSKYLWVSYQDSFNVPIVPGLETTIKTLVDQGYMF